MCAWFGHVTVNALQNLLEVSSCCRAGILRCRTLYVFLERPEPVAISGNTIATFSSF